MLKSRVDHLARRPEDLEKLVEAVTLYHMVIEMLALTGQHFILEYNEQVGTLPGFCEASTRSPATSTVMWRAWGALPARDGPGGHEVRRGDHAHSHRGRPDRRRVLQPKWYVEGETQVLGASLEETRVRDEGADGGCRGSAWRLPPL